MDIQRGQRWRTDDGRVLLVVAVTGPWIYVRGAEGHSESVLRAWFELWELVA